MFAKLALLAIFWMWAEEGFSALPSAFPPAVPPSGAALIYSRAFAEEPKLSTADWQCIRSEPGEPLDRPQLTGCACHGFSPDPHATPLSSAQTTQAVERFSPILKRLAEGAKEPTCEWGLDLNRGERHMEMPPVLECRDCCQVLAIRARLRLEAGDSAGAVDDLLLGFRLARQVSNPPITFPVEIRLCLERALLGCAAWNLSKFDTASLRRLSAGLVALPPAGTLAESIELEKRRLPVSTFYYVEGIKNDVAQGTHLPAVAPQPPAPRPWYLHLFGKESKRMNREREYREMEYKHQQFLVYQASPVTRASWMHAIEADYAALADALRLPYTKGAPQIDVLQTSTGENPLKRLTWPYSSIKQLRREELHVEAMWVVFKVALQARLHHAGDTPARIAALPNPLDGTSLECRDVEGRVKVRLKKEDGKPLVLLTVGLEAAPQ